uniref:glycosyltransferase n=1 Tax=Falsiroseomonas oryzae TaxID=2766473 RepID=UPI0022EA2CCF
EALAQLGPGEPEGLSAHAALLAARCLLDRPDPVRALSFALRAARPGGAAETRIGALLLVGRIRTGLGQERLAAEAYRALLEVRPEHLEGRLLLGRMLVELGWFGLALEALAPLPRPLPGWWRQVEGWAEAGRLRARAAALGLLDRRGKGPNPRELPDLARHLIRAGRMQGARGVIAGLPPGGIRTWLEAWVAEGLAWPDPQPVPDLVLPPETPPSLWLEAALWLMQRGETARAAASIAAVPDAALGKRGWLLRARLLVAQGAHDRLDALATAAESAGADRTLAAQIRLTALTLGGALPTLDAGLLPAAAEATDELPLVQYWDREMPPPDVAKVMDSWRAHHPKRRLLRFHRATARAWIEEAYGADAAAAFDACPHPAVEADLLRYAVLGREGGIWADADDSCKASWDGVLAAVPPAGQAVSFCDELLFYAYNAPLVARPGSPVLLRALRHAIRALLAPRKPGEFPIWFATGPGLLTRQVAADPRGVRLIGRALLRHLCLSEGSLAYKFDREQDWRPD